MLRLPPSVTDRSVILRRMTTGLSWVDRFERRTEWPLAGLALVFLVAYAWPILHPGLSRSWRHICTVTAYAIWATLVVEFIIRLLLTDRRSAYAVRHVPDLLMVALPMLRPLRRAAGGSALIDADLPDDRQARAQQGVTCRRARSCRVGRSERAASLGADVALTAHR
jgi:hypothetical protein